MVIDLNALNAGKNPPHEINVVIEIPKGSNIKYEIGSEAEGGIFVDRILSTSMSYLCNYGFIPKTKEDGDPVDVFVLSNNPVVVMSIIRCKPIGVFSTKDQDGQDSKIIAVPIANIDPNFSSINDIDDVQDNKIIQLKHFIEHHKDLEVGKYVKIAVQMF